MHHISCHDTSQPKRHIFLVCLLGLSLIIGLLYGLPHILWLHELNWDYTNAVFISSFYPADAYHYIAQIKEIYEGNFQLSNAYLAEYKNTTKSPWPVFPYYLSAMIGKICRLDVQFLVMCMDFTFPPLIFLLTFSLLYRITSKRLLSILEASLLVLTPHLAKWTVVKTIGIQLITGAFHLPFLGDASPSVCFSRPINPQMTFVFLLSALFFFLKVIHTQKRTDLILCIVFGVCTSYSYVFFSSYLYTFFGVWVILAGMLKEWKAMKMSFIVLIMNLVVAVPFWYSLFRFSDDNLRQMAWMMKSHTPIINAQVLMMLGICVGIIFFLQQRYVSNFAGIASLSFLISAIICINQQVMTGLHVQPHHYEMYILPQSTLFALFIVAGGRTDKPLRLPACHLSSFLLASGFMLTILSVVFNPFFVKSYLSSDGNLTPSFEAFLKVVHIAGLLSGMSGCVLGILLKTKLSRIDKIFQQAARTFFLNIKQKFFSKSIFQTVLTGIIMVYVCGDIGFVQYQRYTYSIKPEYSDFQALSPALQWLNAHTQKESVLLTMITRFDAAHNKLLVSTDNVIPIYTRNNVYLSHHAQFYAVPSLSELQDRLYNLLHIMGITTHEHFERFIPSVALPTSFIEYQTKLDKNLYSELTTYKVDYLFYGPREQAEFKVDPETAYPFLKKVYDDGFVKIYQIMKKDRFIDDHPVEQ